MKTNAEYLRQWRKANPEKDKENRLRWRHANPDKIKQYNHRQYERRKALKQKGADTDSAV